jgi:hypothetical protein
MLKNGPNNRMQLTGPAFLVLRGLRLLKPARQLIRNVRRQQ